MVQRVDGWWAKGWGVLGWPSLPPEQGLWLPGVSAIHTLFVRFPLDLLFLDADLTALRIVPDVKPWTPLVQARGAHHTVELGAGALAQAGIAARVGEQWELRKAPGE